MAPTSDPAGVNEQPLSIVEDEEPSEVPAADLGVTVDQSPDPDWLGGGFDTLADSPAA